MNRELSNFQQVLREKLDNLVIGLMLGRNLLSPTTSVRSTPSISQSRHPTLKRVKPKVYQVRKNANFGKYIDKKQQHQIKLWIGECLGDNKFYFAS